MIQSDTAMINRGGGGRRVIESRSFLTLLFDIYTNYVFTGKYFQTYSIFKKRIYN